MSILEAAPLKAGDPRAGLQRRYTMEEILALAGGRPKIQGLNYDALTMLRNPLYVKFAQELRERNTEINSAIIQHRTEENAMRQMASEQGLPFDQMREVIERAPSTPPAPEEDDRMDEYTDTKTRGLRFITTDSTEDSTPRRRTDGNDQTHGGGGGRVPPVIRYRCWHSLMS